MKEPKEQRRHAWTVVAIIGGGGAVVFFLFHGANSAARSTAPNGRTPAGRAIAPPSQNVMPNPANANLEESILAAREAALATYDQSAVAERGVSAQQALGIAQDNTNQAIAFNTNATQLKETGLATSAEQAIADEEAAVQRQAITAQESVASQYASAQQTQAQGGFWGSILGGLGGLAGLLGFSQPVSTTGFGTGYVDANGNPISAAQYFGIAPSSSSSIFTPADPWAPIENAPTYPSVDPFVPTLPSGFDTVFPETGGTVPV